MKYVNFVNYNYLYINYLNNKHDSSVRLNF